VAGGGWRLFSVVYPPPPPPPRPSPVCTRRMPRSFSSPCRSTSASGYVSPLRSTSRGLPTAKSAYISPMRSAGLSRRGPEREPAVSPVRTASRNLQRDRMRSTTPGTPGRRAEDRARRAAERDAAEVLNLTAPCSASRRPPLSSSLTYQFTHAPAPVDRPHSVGCLALALRRGPAAAMLGPPASAAGGSRVLGTRRLHIALARLRTLAPGQPCALCLG
jgi:hypothetical protein